ncbi:MAG: carotenoid oxygenase family protein [Streptosporangiaceae bacterium]
MIPTHHPPSRSSRSRSGLWIPASEEMAHGPLPVDGHLPETLDGMFLRIGPDGAWRQPLSGNPLATGLRLRGGRAEWARTTWVRTDRVSRALGELPAPGPRRGLSDDANGGVIRHAGRILALGDGGVLPYELGADLGTRARHDFDGTLPRGFSAHPERDPVTGELYAVAYHHEAPYAQHIIVDTAGRVRRAEPISLKSPSMMHAYSLTEHYAILYDLPVVFSPAAAAAGMRVPYAWDDSHGARLGILPREGADCDVRWIEIEPCYVFHAMNAYETDKDHLVLDVVRYERAFDRKPAHPGETPPALWRWNVDLRGETMHAEQLDDRPQEFPVVDERFKGCPCRYGLTTGMNPESAPYGGHSLLRHNLPSGTAEVHDFGQGNEAGDPVFIPRSAETQEGDGWVMTIVRGLGSGARKLVVLDTADFSGDPVAEIWLPSVGPRGFHSTWLPMAWG